MSRFSLAEAKGLGWKITHQDNVGVEGKPKWNEAEKHLSAPGFPDKTVKEGAETIGLLLERVFAYEAHLRGLGYYSGSSAS